MHEFVKEHMNWLKKDELTDRKQRRNFWGQKKKLPSSLGPVLLDSHPTDPGHLDIHWTGLGLLDSHRTGSGLVLAGLDMSE